VVAACYCLPDGGKLNGELGSWAAPAAEDNNDSGGGGEGGKSSASLSSFERCMHVYCFYCSSIRGVSSSMRFQEEFDQS